jgi:transposase
MYSVFTTICSARGFLDTAIREYDKAVKGKVMSKKKRRTYTSQFKFETVMAGLGSEKSIATVCRERNITESLYYKWRDQFLLQAPSVFTDKRQVSAEADEQAARIADLERLVGKLTLQLEILKKAENWLSQASRKNGS